MAHHLQQPSLEVGSGSGSLMLQREGRPLPNRACQQCKRKKNKCDMEKPSCSLCLRIGEDCAYPTKRNMVKRRGKAASHAVSTGLSEKDQHSWPFAGSDELCDFPALGTQGHGLLGPKLVTNGIREPPISSASVTMSNTMQYLDSNFESDLAFCDLSPPFDDANCMLMTDGPPQWSVMDPTFASWSPDAVRLENPEGGSGNETYRLTMLASADNDGERRDLGKSGKTLIVSPAIADELIDLFFEKVQCSIPLFHRRKFNAQYKSPNCAASERYSNLSSESALLLNAMFSLSARFSTAPNLITEGRLHRGDRFIDQATKIYQELSCENNASRPTLPYLQGLTLFASSLLQSSPSLQSWLLVGTCTRLAYDLDLHNSDADIGEFHADHLSLEEWQYREERRRLWWVIWNMDLFSSTIASKPYAIDSRRANVLLPITDEAWLDNKRVASVPLNQDRHSVWKSLVGCPNQNEWAWFLVCTAVLRHIIEELSVPTGRLQAIQNAEAMAGCFAMALPESFETDTDTLIFDEKHFTASNWVLCTVMMLHCTRSYISLQRTGHMTRREEHSDTMPQSNPGKVRGMRYQQKWSVARYELARTVRRWSPQYMPQSSPLVVACVVGPGLIHILANSQSKDTEDHSLALETLRVSLQKFARFWMIGKILSDLVEESQNPGIAESLSVADDVRARWPWFMPPE